MGPVDSNNNLLAISDVDLVAGNISALVNSAGLFCSYGVGLAFASNSLKREVKDLNTMILCLALRLPICCIAEEAVGVHIIADDRYILSAHSFPHNDLCKYNIQSFAMATVDALANNLGIDEAVKYGLEEAFS